MDTAGLLSAWWIPKEEEELWKASCSRAPEKIVFMTGMFVMCNSMSHSLVKIFFDKTHMIDCDHVWLPHRIVEMVNALVTCVYGLVLFLGFSKTDTSFSSDRVFAFSEHQDLLTNAQIAFALYSIAVSLFNFTAFGRARVWLNLMRGSDIIGMNYLYLLFPSVLGARLRIYWSVLEVGMVSMAATNLLVHLRFRTNTVVYFAFASLALSMLRVWLWTCSLFWAYAWMSENLWYGIPPEVPVSNLLNAYLTGTGIGAIGMSYFAFIDFRRAIQEIKEWSHRCAQSAK